MEVVGDCFGVFLNSSLKVSVKSSGLFCVCCSVHQRFVSFGPNCGTVYIQCLCSASDFFICDVVFLILSTNVFIILQMQMNCSYFKSFEK